MWRGKFCEKLNANWANLIYSSFCIDSDSVPGNFSNSLYKKSEENLKIVNRKKKRHLIEWVEKYYEKHVNYISLSKLVCFCFFYTNICCKFYLMHTSKDWLCDGAGAVVRGNCYLHLLWCLFHQLSECIYSTLIGNSDQVANMFSTFCRHFYS